MALNALVDNIESVPEAFRTEYKPIEDGDNKGKFMLDVSPSGGYGLDNVEGLKTTYAAIRTELDTAKAAMSGYSGLKLKPSEISAKMKRLAELETFDPETEADKRAEAKLHGFKTSLTGEFEAKLTEKDARSARLVNQVEKLLVTSALQDALSKHKGNPALLLPVLMGRIKVKEDPETGTFTPHVMDESGNADMTFRDGKVEASTIEDLVKKIRDDARFGVAFESSGKAGSEAPRTAGGNGGSMKFTQQQWLEKTARATPEERSKLFKEAAAGRMIVTN